jgi:hypothetical protein
MRRFATLSNYRRALQEPDARRTVLPSLALLGFCRFKFVGGDEFLLDSHNVSLIELGMMG